MSIRALRRFCREDILIAKREDGRYGRKWGGWKGRSFLYYIALTAKIRARSLIAKPETEGCHAYQ
jgi:hypothetical protein